MESTKEVTSARERALLGYAHIRAVSDAERCYGKHEA